MTTAPVGSPAPPQTAPRDLTPWLLASILLLSVLLRVGVALYLGDTLEETRGGTYDQISYDALAQRVVAGYGFSFAEDSWPYARANQPTAFWSYLYTLFLAGIYTVVGHQPLIARLVQSLLAGILTGWLLYRIGSRVWNRRVGLIAAAMIGVYFYFIHYAASLMTEAFYIVGILWTTDAAMRLADRIVTQHDNSQSSAARRPWGLAVELGLAMGVTLLLRQVVVVYFMILAVWLIWIGWRRQRATNAVSLLIVAAAISAVLISPFILRNYRVFGRLALPNTNAGFTFFWSNHPIYGTRFEAVLSPNHGVSYRDLIPPELRDLNEAALDRALLGRGLQFVLKDPSRYVLLSLSRIPVYFQFWPTADSSLLSNVARLLSFALFLPLMIYGLVIAIRHMLSTRACTVGSVETSYLQGAYIALMVLFIAIYTLVHLASWANVRYRLPVDAFLILFAAYAVDSLLQRWLQTRQHTAAAVAG